MQHSGLQKQVLHLYRQILRQGISKDLDTTSAANKGKHSFLKFLQDDTTTTGYARMDFRKQASSVGRSEFQKIEYMIRKGQKQLKQFSNTNCMAVSAARQMHSES